MAQPPFLHYLNLASAPDASVTCAVAGETATDLLTPWLDESLVTSNATDAVIDVDWGGAVAASDGTDEVAFVGLVGVNWSAAQAVRIRLSSAFPWDAGAVLWDTGIVPGLPTYQITPRIPYPADLPAQRLFVRMRSEGGILAPILVPDPVVGVRSVRIELTGGVEPWQIGTLWLGPLWSPDEALSPVNEREVRDLSKVQPTSWGSVIGEPVGGQYVETLQVAFQRHVDTVDWMNLMAATGQVNPLVVLRNPAQVGSPLDCYSEGGLRRREGAEVRLPALVAMAQTSSVNDASSVDEIRLVRWR